MLRTSWRSATAIVERIVADVTRSSRDLLTGDRAPAKATATLVAVTDHDTDQLIWAAPAQRQATVEALSDTFGPSAPLSSPTLSADGGVDPCGRPGQRHRRRRSASTRSTWSPARRRPSPRSSAASLPSYAPQGDGRSGGGEGHSLGVDEEPRRPHLDTLEHGLPTPDPRPPKFTCTHPSPGRAYGFHLPEPLIAIGHATRSRWLPAATNPQAHQIGKAHFGICYPGPRCYDAGADEGAGPYQTGKRAPGPTHCRTCATRSLSGRLSRSARTAAAKYQKSG